MRLIREFIGCGVVVGCCGPAGPVRVGVLEASKPAGIPPPSAPPLMPLPPACPMTVATSSRVTIPSWINTPHSVLTGTGGRL